MFRTVQGVQECNGVKAYCFPFNQIPGTTPLFNDFLSNSPAIKQLYPRSSRFSDWFRAAAAELNFDADRRERVAEILERQNKLWNASTATQANIGRFRSGACAVVTGQQVGLFGGPLFTLLKALTAIKLADEACRGGVDCVPIFWLANEDHDLAEVNHVSILDPDYSLRQLTTSIHGLPNASVGGIAFGEEIAEVVGQAAQILGESDITDLLREIYRPGETFGSAFAQFLARLFGEYGLILLDGSDSELRAIARPIFRAAIERSTELDEALLSRGRALEVAGYHQQVKVTPSSTLLFAIRNGERLPIHRRTGSSEEFAIGSKQIALSELSENIDREPHNFSPNALLRPVVQDYLLPTLAYAGGPAEVAYFAQNAVVYEKLLGRITPIVSRLSATLIADKSRTLLERYDLTFPDLFVGTEALQRVLAMRTLPPQTRSVFDTAAKALDESMNAIRTTMQHLDPTLVEPTTTAASKMQHQIELLRGKAARAEAGRNEVLGRHARILGNTLYPDKNLQEREIAGVFFLAQFGSGLINQLNQALRTDYLDHQLIPLSK